LQKSHRKGSILRSGRFEYVEFEEKRLTVFQAGNGSHQDAIGNTNADIAELLDV